jgi:hypothetical protein
MLNLLSINLKGSQINKEKKLTFLLSLWFATRKEKSAGEAVPGRTSQGGAAPPVQL